MSNVHPVSTLLHKMIKLNSLPDSTGPMTEVPYTKAIGSLMYVALSTWPDLAFAVQHLLCRTERSIGPQSNTY